MKTLIGLVVSLIVGPLIVNCLWCDRSPSGIHVPKLPGDGGYKIVITGEPDKYVPGAVYTVRLQAPGDQFAVEKFSGFLLVAEPGEGHTPESPSGSFHVESDSLARFSENCPHAVKHTSELAKTDAQVRWTAPAVAAGCVVFRATVIKNKGHWFMDDGLLTRTLCAESEDGQEDQDNLEPCCACDEAKYELTFEGLWSSLTHPKDFPADTLSAHFSDIVGASHSPNFRVWEYGGEASEGLRSIAEDGDSKDLESELKEKSDEIRTIIRARGLKNANFYGHKTFAVFRVDKDHNLISIVSKIVPSPDWFVGVTGLNLCLPNCTWKADKVLDLFPWDAGTNDGITYSVPGDPTRDRIRRIVWTSEESSPFFDQSGNIVKPFARLRLSKQRSYQRDCALTNDYGDDQVYHESEHQHKPECQVSSWTEWSQCSVSCGRGTQARYRQYTNPAKATDFGCSRKLSEKKNCYNNARCWKAAAHQFPNQGGGSQFSRGAMNKDPFMVEYESAQQRRNNPCSTTEWFPWSLCSATCGFGRRTRERKWLNSQLARSSQCTHVQLQEHEICVGSIRDCADVEQVEPGCETTSWSEWGPCSVSCGKGTRVRTRLFVNSRINHQKCDLELTQYETCQGAKAQCNAPEDMREICMLPKQVGMCPNDGNLTRWYFDMHKLRCQKFTFYPCKGNQNNFLSEKDCETSCSVLKESLIQGTAAHSVPPTGYGSGGTSYSSYGGSSIGSNIGGGGGGGSMSGGGGNNYNNNYNNNWPSYQPYNPTDGPPVDCVVSDWSDWSACSATCGRRGHKAKTRYVKIFSANGGAPCPPLITTRKCKDFSCAAALTGSQPNTMDMEDYQE